MQDTLKRVFITGANGLIGRAMAALLHEKGVETCGIDKAGIFGADFYNLRFWPGE